MFLSFNALVLLRKLFDKINLEFLVIIILIHIIVWFLWAWYGRNTNVYVTLAKWI